MQVAIGPSPLALAVLEKAAGAHAVLNHVLRRPDALGAKGVLAGLNSPGLPSMSSLQAADAESSPASPRLNGPGVAGILASGQSATGESGITVRPKDVDNVAVDVLCHRLMLRYTRSHAVARRLVTGVGQMLLPPK